MMARFGDIGEFGGVKYRSMEGIFGLFALIEGIEEMARSIGQPVWHHDIWRNDFAENLMEASRNSGANTVDALETQTSEQKIRPWVSFSVSVFQYPWRSEGNPDLSVGDHVDLDLRDVEIVIKDDMQGMLDGQTLSRKEIDHGRVFLKQALSDFSLTIRVVQKQAVLLDVDHGQPIGR